MTTPGEDTGRERPADEEDVRLADIVRSSHDAIVGGTLDGVVTAWNRAAERLYGYHAEEIIGRRAERLYPRWCWAREAAVLRQIAGGEQLDQYVTERIHRDGSTLTVRLSVSPIADGTGKIVGVAAISRDVRGATVNVRETRRPPAGPETADRTRVVLPAGTSHELRTPLQAVIGFTGTLLLRLPGPLNDEQERQLELVQQSARQLLEMINELSRPAAN
ncbi:PAS domain S-box protein [Actinoplanes flavus]|uniref:histidine kinase n=1 Tax=Actinoplanes flavus TaxID=2820290 RepID=A0ABS3UWY8_9ACTN|nr:PAS domain S-box protein [Actinoplanes flavus]MBO3743104.1 PAS domain S-box protein [Actinoplanes flavus]